MSRKRRKATWLEVENILGSTFDHGVKFWLDIRVLVGLPDLENRNIGHLVEFEF